MPDVSSQSQVGSNSDAVSSDQLDSNVISADELKDKIEVKAVPALSGLYCVFITNNSDVIIDELGVQLNYLDDKGTVVDLDTDGHDMVLPGRTVVSRMKAPKEFSEVKSEIEIEVGVNPSCKNHMDNVVVSADKGEDGIIIQITNNSDVEICEIEDIVVLYKGIQAHSFN